MCSALSHLPLVTVVTPTFNQGHYLKEALDSVLTQDYPKLEYIVLDDGSTDDTPSILASYAERFSDRFRSLKHDNIGQARTLNRGFAEAQGTMIGIVNSNDTLLAGAIRTLVDALLAEPDAVLAYGDEVHVDQHNEVIQHYAKLDYSLADMVRLFDCLPGAAVLFRREVVDCIGGWDPSFGYCPDFDWYIRAGLIGRFRHVHQSLGARRPHADSMTKPRRGLGMAHDFVRMIEQLYARDDLPRELEAVRGEALRTAYFTAGVVIAGPPNSPAERFELTDRLPQIQTLAERLPTGLNATIAWLHGEVAARDSTIEMLHREVAVRDATIKKLHAEVALRDAKVKALYRGVGSSSTTVAWLHREVAERDETITRLHREVALRDEAIHSLRNEARDPTISSPLDTSIGTNS